VYSGHTVPVIPGI